MGYIAGKIFSLYASSGVERAIAEMQKKYTPASGNRFILKGITYEISPPKLTEKGFEIDLSCDIPKNELKILPVTYFKRVKREISIPNCSLEYIKADTPAKTKGRRGLIIGIDRILMKSVYDHNDLYHEENIFKEARNIMTGNVKAEIECIDDANTIMGKLILYYIRENLYKKTKENIQLLIDANEIARKSLSLKDVKGAMRK